MQRRPQPCDGTSGSLPQLGRRKAEALPLLWFEIFQRQEESPLTSLIEDEAASCSSLTLLCILWKKRLDYDLLLSSLSVIKRAAVVYSEDLELSHVVYRNGRRRGSVASKRT
mmetsp:Transcript_28557/g.92152  ORF Transcript_28557/g.92152 Transcript_28557/m.92152 type:complete len:112 (+) Transcript_28557:358-693(+)